MTSRMLGWLLTAVAVVLPRSWRRRWQEESLALLLEVHGFTRLRYTIDTVAKVPVLAWQQRRLADLGGVAAGSAGVALLAATAALPAGLFAGQAIAEGTAEFLVLASLCGMAPVAALWAWRTATRFRPAAAAAAGFLAGTGPIAAGVVSTGLEHVAPAGLAVAVAVGASVLPGGWMIWAGLERCAPPWPGRAGRARHDRGYRLIPVLVNVQLISRVDGRPPLVSVGALLALLLLAPSYVAWAVWSGLRMLSSRPGPLPPAAGPPVLPANAERPEQLGS